MRVHAYPFRKYRDRSIGRNVCIRIVSLICANARAVGTRYTIRLLPKFLVPRCVIRLDHALEAVEEREEAGASMERCCQVMGCLDLRTARMHLRQAGDVVCGATLTLAEAAAATPELGALPAGAEQQKPLQRLRALVLREEQARIRAGHLISSPSMLQFVHRVLCGQNQHHKPSSSESQERPPP
jgi:hypothetical protein